MSTTKIEFLNTKQEKLSAKLELPADRHPHNFALFAHCFTCSKNLGAVRNISAALTASGFGVLRFDFTGLGESEGDFADTNFSSNVEDLLAACKFLSDNYSSPTLLVGHSLGGAAVLRAAAELPNAKAVATIGAPSDPAHVKKLLQSNLEEIERSGKAEVDLGGRNFTIKKQFLDDLEAQSAEEVLKKMHASLLILHAPLDDTVSIKNAEMIYHHARHPKSFISLDGADHLLSSKKDSLYAGRVIAEWASRYVKQPQENKPRTRHQVVASLDAQDAFTTYVKAGDHYLVADEPLKAGGNNFGPSPYDLLAASLATCTAMTIRVYTTFKKWDLRHVEVHVSHSKDHLSDCENCETSTTKIDVFNKEIRIEGELDEAQRKKILLIADKCPVHKSLHNTVKVITKYSDAAVVI